MYYVPDGQGGFRAARDMLEWGEWFARKRDESFIQGGKRVARTELAGGILISTVFLGLDHSFSHSGPPVLFETMIFGGPHNDYQERYTTLADAQQGHEQAVALAQSQESST